jgi:hypothetical protein
LLQIRLGGLEAQEGGGRAGGEQGGDGLDLAAGAWQGGKAFEAGARPEHKGGRALGQHNLRGRAVGIGLDAQRSRGDLQRPDFAVAPDLDWNLVCLVPRGDDGQVALRFEHLAVIFQEHVAGLDAEEVSGAVGRDGHDRDALVARRRRRAALGRPRKGGIGLGLLALLLQAGCEIVVVRGSSGVVRAQCLEADGHCLAVEGLGFGGLPLALDAVPEVLVGDSDIGMIRHQGLDPDGQRPAQERLGLGVLALLIQHSCKAP